MVHRRGIRLLSSLFSVALDDPNSCWRMYVFLSGPADPELGLLGKNVAAALAGLSMGSTKTPDAL